VVRVVNFVPVEVFIFLAVCCDVVVLHGFVCLYLFIVFLFVCLFVCFVFFVFFSLFLHVFALLIISPIPLLYSVC
jgi:hypothetical protein